MYSVKKVKKKAIRKSDNMKKLRIIFLILTIACIAFIWKNSFATGAKSSDCSGFVKDIINYILSLFGAEPLTEHVVRKVAHFTEFSALAFLLILDFILYDRKNYMGYGLFIGLLVALIDETIQLFSNGRSSSVIDVWIDFSGLCCGFIITFLFYKIFSNRKQIV